MSNDFEWRNDGNYGQVCYIPELPVSARVAPSLKNKYHAKVMEPGVRDHSRSDFESMAEARAWAEKYMAVYAENIELRRKVELQRGWLKHYAEELSELRGKINDAVWQEANERIQAVLASKGNE